MHLFLKALGPDMLWEINFKIVSAHAVCVCVGSLVTLIDFSIEFYFILHI